MESFIVRVWVPEEGNGDAEQGLHGKVVHLATGANHTFRDPEELVRLIRTKLSGTLILPDSGRPLK